jgi:dihydroneopterin aldolase
MRSSGAGTERRRVTDRIVLSNLAFFARHGVEPWEKLEEQAFHVDVELSLDLGPAGRSDDLARTVDYAAVYAIVQRIVEGPSVDLVEALAESIASRILAEHALVDEVVVRVRKPEVRLGGPLESAGVEIRRRR